MTAKNGKKPNPNLYSTDKQPPNESKRVKKKKTIIKEKLGLAGWESIRAYMGGDGAERFIAEMEGLDEKAFCDIYLSASEYFTPKLSRTEIDHSGGAKIILTRRIISGKP